MSQWINKFPIKPIYFCLLLVLTYFAIYTSSLSAYLGLAVLLVRLFWLYSTRNSLLVLVFLSLFAGFFLFRREMANKAFRDEPETISTIVIKPDTIKVNEYYLADVEDLETNTYYIDSRWAESFFRTSLA